MRNTPSNAQLIKAAPLMQRVDEQNRARGDAANILREPRNFPDFCLRAVGIEEGAILNPELVRNAINLAFMLGVCYDDA